LTRETKALRLLLVDDHPLVRTGIAASLRRAFRGLQIQEAGCAADCLELMASFRPDLALLDVNLPGTNGLDLAQKLQALDKGTKILIVAADADPWTVSEALRAGATGFLAKSNSAELLAHAVRAVLAGQVFLCPDARSALRRAEPPRAAGGAPPGPAVLSSREREVLRHIALGQNTKSIAFSLGISPKTVETHRQHILRKLRLQSVADLTRYAISHGMVPA
jgi:DNA-binding NarL/FixJ family response regulator